VVAAPGLLVPLLLLPPPVPLGEPAPGLFPAVGADGTEVPVADARHELANDEADAEALLFTVPLPAKLHVWALFLFAS